MTTAKPAKGRPQGTPGADGSESPSPTENQGVASESPWDASGTEAELDPLTEFAAAIVDYFANACGACSLGIPPCTEDEAACAPRETQERFVLGKLRQAIEALAPPEGPHVLRLSVEDTKRFDEIMAGPFEPNEKLKEAARRYQEAIDSGRLKVTS